MGDRRYNPGFAQLVERIKSEVDIVSFLEEHGGLTYVKRGRENNFASCPFHDEKTASFSANSQKQFYHCFGCGESGDLIRFYMKQHSVTFPEALKEIANLTGLPVPVDDPKQEEELRRIKAIITASKGYFIEQLARSDKAQEYVIDRRQISERSCRDWEIGYATDAREKLKNHLKEKGYKEEDLLMSGVISQGDHGTYDRFRARIIFPLIDQFGETVGFAGRVLDQGEPKYLNSPETLLYHKSKFLFGLNKAIPQIREAKEALITEGYLDVISAHQAGIRNVVGTSGLAFTTDHARLLRRHTQKIAFIMDADRAGIRGAKQGAKIAYGVGFAPEMILIPVGKDLDDLVRGSDSPKEELAGIPRMNVIDFLLKTSNNINTPEAKLAVINEVAEFVDLESDPVRKSLYLLEVAKQLDIPHYLIKPRLESLAGMKRNGAKQNGFGLEDVVWTYYANLLLHQKEYAAPYIQEIPITDEFFPDISGSAREFYEVLKELFSTHTTRIQLPLRLVHEAQNDLFSPQQTQSFFDYVAKKVEEKKLTNFPDALIRLLQSNGLPKRLDQCKGILKWYIREQKQDRLLHELFDAVRGKDKEKEAEATKKLEELLI